MAGFGWGATSDRAVPLAGWALAFALLTIPTGPGPTPQTAPPDHLDLGSGGAGPLPLANLSVAPAAGWVEDGSTTPLTANWSEVDPACTVTPDWFRWFLGPGPVGGVLLDPNGSTDNFTGAAVRTETTELGVRSAATVSCAGGSGGVYGSAYANLTTVPSLTLQDLSLAPALLTGPGEAQLTGDVLGGLPPYLVEVRWGDGNVSNLSVAGSGPFDWAHRYPLGIFVPRVTLLDSMGAETNASVDQPLEADPESALAILPSFPVAEAGLPIRFLGEVQPAPISEVMELTACGQSSLASLPSPIVLTCDPTQAGPLPVLLQAFWGGPLGEALQTLRETVVPALTVSVDPLQPTGEIGPPVLFEVCIQGGVAPFELAGSAAGFQAPPEGVIPSDGTFLLEETPSGVGFAALSLQVSDADGVVAVGPEASVFVEPGLALGLGGAVSRLPPTAHVSVDLHLTGGVAPIAWAVTARPMPGSGGPDAGWATGPSSHEWSGDFGVEGSGSVEVLAVDAAGEWVASSMNFPLLAPPTGRIVVGAAELAGGPAANVSLALSGGLPPFLVWVNCSGSAGWNSTDPSDGPFSAEVPLSQTGPVRISVVVVDRGGGRIAVVESILATLLAPPPSPPAGASPDATPYLVLALAIVLVVSGGVLYRTHRRRHARPPLEAPDPARVLEGILSPADGAERITVELLAEEAGVPLDTVRSTLDRLIADGRVRSEVSPEGEEVLAWSAPLRS